MDNANDDGFERQDGDSVEVIESMIEVCGERLAGLRNLSPDLTHKEIRALQDKLSGLWARLVSCGGGSAPSTVRAWAVGVGAATGEGSARALDALSALAERGGGGVQGLARAPQTTLRQVLHTAQVTPHLARRITRHHARLRRHLQRVDGHSHIDGHSDGHARSHSDGQGPVDGHGPGDGHGRSHSDGHAHQAVAKAAAVAAQAHTPPRVMLHTIEHRFVKTFNMIATCDYCDKQMLFGASVKCKHCKFKCHRECEPKVPASCGLPPQFVSLFKHELETRSPPPAPAAPALAPVATPAPAPVAVQAPAPHSPPEEPTPTLRRPPPREPSADGDIERREGEWEIDLREVRWGGLVGAGRWGAVYRAHWHGAVALKLLHARHLLRDPAALQHFRKEVHTLRKTRHENLVLFMGASCTPPALAILTAFCTGLTLYTHLHLRRDKFTHHRQALIAHQVAQGMGYLHARQILHKDLSTKNIFLEGGRAVITDFGLVSMGLGDAGAGGEGGMVVRAHWLWYLAPELVRELPCAPRLLPWSTATDVYAFGTVWFEVTCGAWPWAGAGGSGGAQLVIWRVGRGALPPLPQALVTAPPPYAQVLMSCWAYRPKRRPSFAALLTQLGRLPRPRHALARSPSHPLSTHLSRSHDTLL